jgi:hypothetical protein
MARLLALLLAFAFPQGDAALDLQAKVRAALHGSKNVVATITINPQPMAPMGGTITYTYVAPNRYRQTVSGIPGADDTIVIGDQVYGRHGNAWDVQTWTDELVRGYEGDLFDVVVLDVGHGGFTMKDPHGKNEGDTRICTYDKATSRPKQCAMSYGTVTYRYDDPAVTIPTPPNPKRVD